MIKGDRRVLRFAVKKICANKKCGKSFFARKKSKNGQQTNSLRMHNCITCSKKCSREYCHDRRSKGYA